MSQIDCCQSLTEMVAVVEVEATLYLVAPSAQCHWGVMARVLVRDTWNTTRFAHGMEGVVVRASVLGWSDARGLSEQLWPWGCSVQLPTELQHAGVDSWPGIAGAGISIRQRTQRRTQGCPVVCWDQIQMVGMAKKR